MSSRTRIHKGRRPPRATARSRQSKARDYAAEYEQRIARALARGHSRSQARGHPKAGEKAISAKRRPGSIPDELLQSALRVLRQRNLRDAAKALHISPERLRAVAEAKRAIRKKGRRWVINANLPRRMLLYSRRKPVRIIIGDQSSASLVGTYMSAVAKFLERPNIDLLKPFVGKSVTDIGGKKHSFETDPNWLYRLSSAGGESFTAVYRIII